MTKPTQYQSTDVLITVMTYPHPSRGYSELVCTAGITRSFEWVRLYPVDYRYRARHQQFRKYQWINVGLADRGAGNDNRRESRRPDPDSIRILGDPLSTDHCWRERREIIDRMPVRTVNQLKSLYDSENTSIGIVKPTELIDIEIEPADPEWKPEWQALFNQLNRKPALDSHTRLSSTTWSMWLFIVVWQARVVLKSTSEVVPIGL